MLPTLVKVTLAVMVGLVVFAMRVFEVPCAKSIASLGLVVKIAFYVYSYVRAWPVKWSMRSKSVDTNSMDSTSVFSAAQRVVETAVEIVGKTFG